MKATRFPAGHGLMLYNINLARACGERIEIALRLHELASEVARAGIRAQHPDADAEEVERQLLERRRLAYHL